MFAVAAALALSISALDIPPAAPREFRGVWVATVDHIDWPPKDVFDTEKQKEKLIEILDRAQQLHFNAVLLQVRPMGDALYDSPYEPWSEFLTGAQGKRPDPDWDPLAFAVWEAHQRGLELHAWFNPYRVWHPAAKGQPASTFLGNTHPDWVKHYGKFMWLDPGQPGVKEWSQKVILDVVRRYDIDGVHLDDYFYPYPVKGVPFPDDASWNAYLSSGGKLQRADWRRHNVDTFVETLYHRIKNVKPWVKFGISPFGIYRPGTPASIKAGVDQYDGLYADPVKWLKNGWVDYLAPQLYWPIHQTAQSYSLLANWWSSQNTLKRHVWIGNFASQLNGPWPAKELLDQIALTRRVSCEDGNIMYSMAPFMRNAKGIDQALTSGPYASLALVPTCPWLNTNPPTPPKLSVTRSGQGPLLHMKKESATTHEWALYVKKSGQWQFSRLISADQPSLLLSPSVIGVGVSKVAISALNRYGNESRRVSVAF